MRKLIFAVEDTQVVRRATEWLASSGIFSGSDIAVVNACPRASEDAPITIECKNRFEEVYSDARFQAITLNGGTNNLLDFASNNNCELLVVAKTERSSLDKLLHGSVSQQLLEHSNCPVLLAKDCIPEAAGNVIIAVDDSSNSAAALEWASRQLWLKQKRVLLLSVIRPASAGINSFTSTAQAAETLLKRQVEESVLSLLLEAWGDLLAQRLDRASVPFMIPEGEAKDAILETARMWPAELIVMGTHGRSGLNKLMLGSVSQSVSVSAPCSCLVIRTDESLDGDFNKVRTEIENSSELFRARKEKPHPARVSSSCVGTDLNGFFINF